MVISLEVRRRPRSSQTGFGLQTDECRRQKAAPLRGRLLLSIQLLLISRSWSRLFARRRNGDRSRCLPLGALLNDAWGVSTAIDREISQDAKEDKRESKNPRRLLQDVRCGTRSQDLLRATRRDTGEPPAFTTLQKDDKRHQNSDESDDDDQKRKH